MRAIFAIIVVDIGSKLLVIFDIQIHIQLRFLQKKKIKGKLPSR